MVSGASNTSQLSIGNCLGLSVSSKKVHQKLRSPALGQQLRQADPSEVLLGLFTPLARCAIGGVAADPHSKDVELHEFRFNAGASLPEFALRFQHACRLLETVFCWAAFGAVCQHCLLQSAPVLDSFLQASHGSSSLL